MKPINKYILVNKSTEQIETDSGLLLSDEDANKFRYQKANVVKAGTNVEAIKESDEIYYDKSAGFDMIIKGSTYTVILERDVVVVL